MIEICYGHKRVGNVLHVKKLSIGHGFPHHGQMDFITLIEEEIEMGTGEFLWARMIWALSFRTIRNKLQRQKGIVGRLSRIMLEPYFSYQEYPRFGYIYRHKRYKGTIDVGVIVLGCWLGVLIDYSEQGAV